MAFLQKKKLPKRSPRLSKWLLAYAGALLIIIGVQPVKAENLIVTAPTDYWFNYDVPTTFTARTYEVPNHPSDPQLWFYNSEGTLIGTNDDWYGLQSFIQVQVEPGWYRLRAGVCCGQPDVWGPNSNWNLDYQLEISGFTNSPTTTTSSTVEETTTTSSTTTTSTTTSTTTTTTTTEVPWTTTSSTLLISEPSTTLLPISSTTTETTFLPTTTTSTVLSTTLPALTTTTIPRSTSSSSIPQTTTTVSPTTTATTSPPTTVTAISAVSTTSSTTPPAIDDLPESVAESIAVLAEVSTPGEIAAAVDKIAASLDSLNAEQLDQIALAVSKAPTEVKKKFESEINIFGGGLDNYVPTGSTVSVGERRTLVVVGAVMTAMPVLASRKK